MEGQEANDSKSQQEQPVTKEMIMNAHRHTFLRAEKNISEAFLEFQHTLDVRKTEILDKIHQIEAEQRQFLEKTNLTLVEITNMQQNAILLDGFFRSLLDSASKLSHLHLNLVRCSGITSPQGKLATFLTLPNPTLTPDVSATRLCGPVGHYIDSQPPCAELESYDTPENKTIEPTETTESTETINKSGDNALSCFVFFLPDTMTDDGLRELFMRYGTIKDAYVAKDRITNRPRGFGFVKFSTHAEAQAAVIGLDKYPMNGKFLSVSIKV